ncbi:MAG: sulfite exporter TauE/SafE family protein, partial [Candidatus Krumholzibacteriota bacterium]|nr:sulfite exporter TauE/SafE family protein [Candidatus Krumholzibacteriota bacterium]
LALAAGAFYAAGRALVYTAIGIILLYSVTSAPALSFWLQRHMLKLLGPVLIVSGMFLLGLIGAKMSVGGMSERTAERVGSTGIWGAGLLGMLFALSFCPTSAALFFGSLLPLAAGTGSRILLPALYGIGTALPVIVFAAIIAAGAGALGKAFDVVTRVEIWARRVTGVLFIGTGVWFSLKYVFKIC